MPGLAIILGLGLVLLWAMVVVWTAWLLTHPPRRTYSAAVARGLPGDPAELTPSRPFSTWTFRDHRGRELPVWDIPGDDPAGPTVVLTHGWGDSRIGGLVRIGALVPATSRLILWDLPGHGESPGACSLRPHEVCALVTLLRVLREQGAGELVLYGWSLGAVCSIEAATLGAASVRAVIAESPYRFRATPARNVLRARGLPHRLTLRPALMVANLATAGPRSAFTPFDCASAAAPLKSSLTVIHGTSDAVSPFEDGVAVAAAGGTLVRIEGGGHNDLWTNPTFVAQATAAIARRIG